MNVLPGKFICLLIVCFIAVASGIPEGQAQEPPTNYRLVEPTAEDYANEVDTIVALAETPTGEGISELDALADELQWRLIEPGQMPYQPLLRIYRAYAQIEGSTTDDSFIRLLARTMVSGSSR